MLQKLVGAPTLGVDQEYDVGEYECRNEQCNRVYDDYFRVDPVRTGRCRQVPHESVGNDRQKYHDVRGEIKCLPVYKRATIGKVLRYEPG